MPRIAGTREWTEKVLSENVPQNPEMFTQMQSELI